MTSLKYIGLFVFFLVLLTSFSSALELFVTDLDGNTLGAREDDEGTAKKKFFYHPDHLGSTDLVTDENGNVVEETTYKPYGDIVEDGFSRFLYTGK